MVHVRPSMSFFFLHKCHLIKLTVPRRPFKSRPGNPVAGDVCEANYVNQRERGRRRKKINILNAQ